MTKQGVHLPAKTEPNTLKNEEISTIFAISDILPKITGHGKKQENVIHIQEENQSVERGPEMTEMREPAKTLKELLWLYSSI